MDNYGVITGVEGNIQFDTNRKLIGLWEHGTISSWSEIPAYDRPKINGYMHILDYNINVTGVAVRPSTSSVVAGRVGKVPPYAGWQLPNRNGVGGRCTIFQSGANSIEYAIYSPDAESRTIPPWGLVTYDENQEIVFNSGLRHLKITEIIEVNRSPFLNFDNPGTVTINHSAQNPFYIIPNNHGYAYYFTTPGWGRFWFGALGKMIGVRKISSTSARLEWFNLYGTEPMDPDPSKVPDHFYVPNPLRIAVCVL